MTLNELQTRTDKANGLKVFPIDNDSNYLVESSAGKICYKVSYGNGNDNICTCADFLNKSQQERNFLCKHILAVKNGNGNIMQIPSLKSSKPKLDNRFISNIKGKDFVVYSGLLDLAHQIGINSIDVEVVQYPTKDNGMEAICKAVVESKNGEEYVEWGDANPKNVTAMVKEHILRIAATRAKARAFRDMTNIGITCLEELGEIDNIEVENKNINTNPKKTKQETKAETKAEVKPETKREGNKENERANANTNQKSDTKNKHQEAEKKAEPEKNQDQKSAPNQKERPGISAAQKNAILNLGKRRGLSIDDIEKMSREAFSVSIENLSTQDASALIRNLQQAA